MQGRVGRGQEHETPSTVTLVFLFLAWFVVMYRGVEEPEPRVAPALGLGKH